MFFCRKSYNKAKEKEILFIPPENYIRVIRPHLDQAVGYHVSRLHKDQLPNKSFRIGIVKKVNIDSNTLFALYDETEIKVDYDDGDVVWLQTKSEPIDQDIAALKIQLLARQMYVFMLSLCCRNVLVCFRNVKEAKPVIHLDIIEDKYIPELKLLRVNRPDIKDAAGHWIVHLRHDKLDLSFVDYKEGLVDRANKDTLRMIVIYIKSDGTSETCERIYNDNEIVWLKEKTQEPTATEMIVAPNKRFFFVSLVIY